MYTCFVLCLLLLYFQSGLQANVGGVGRGVDSHLGVPSQHGELKVAAAGEEKRGYPLLAGSVEKGTCISRTAREPELIE